LIAKESGLNDLLLRPLSAKNLPVTHPEKKGWVNRDQLLGIQGRSRKVQLITAKKLNINDFPQPAGGCLLCEKEFGKKLFEMFKKWPDGNGEDIALLKFGRHFWEGKSLIVLGRNHQENQRLEMIFQPRKVGPFWAEESLIIPKGFPGPTALIRSKKISPATIKKAKKMILSYSPKASVQPQFVVR
jgi:hypothetical protein